MTAINTLDKRSIDTFEAIVKADSGGLLDRYFILKEIGDCLWYLGALCRELGTTLSFVALMNLRKLYDRQQRNQLQGGGDNR